MTHMSPSAYTQRELYNKDAFSWIRGEVGRAISLKLTDVGVLKNIFFTNG